MDHEFGSDELQTDQRGWDWYALQLDDGRELMLYVLRQKDGGITPQSSGSLVARNGRVRHLRLGDFQTQALGTWKSPASGAVYPSGWRVRVPSEGLDVTITPLLLNQELIDEQLIRDTCLVGTADELIEQIRALESDGLQEMIFAVGTASKWRLAEDFARQVMARL